MKSNDVASRSRRYQGLCPLTTAVLVYLSYFLYEQPSAASFPRAVSLAQENRVQEQKAEADSLFQRGNQQFHQSKFQDALSTYQQVFKLRQAIGDKAGEGQTLYRIGITYRHLARYPQ